MPTSTSQLAVQRVSDRVNRIPTVCVVDPNAADYQGWDALAQTRGVRLELFATAGEALRFARTAAVDLWVVNTHLPGLSGYELCSMLKARSASAPVYLIADECTPESERAAWLARATLFGCKGGHCDWLSAWLKRESSQGEESESICPKSRTDVKHNR